ncbi:hypothetical protein [Treponema berlinense]|uniref:hypothetical protein n=1 Tax=Treponema berlinense TaxID=225004 RepID=UPI003FD863AA
MKKLFTFFLLIILPVTIFASPFGLKKGMTIEQIAEVCNGNELEHIEGDMYSILPSKSHPFFKIYIAFVNEKAGLYGIKALSDEISVNDYGTEIKTAFENIKDRIAKTYGIPKIIDEIDPTSVYKDENYWTYSLSKGARTLAAIWGVNEKKLPDDLSGIAISAKAQIGPQIGAILLEYKFNNYDQIEDEQDSVF